MPESTWKDHGWTKEDANQVSENDSFTIVHRTICKINALILNAPAGGLFHNATVDCPWSDYGEGHFELNLGDDVKFEVRVTRK